MRRLLVTLGVVVLLGILAPAARAEFFKVYVTRIDQDLYKDQRSGLYIQTQYCYHYCYGEEAILKLEGPHSYGNQIIFSSDPTPYRVVKVFK